MNEMSYSVVKQSETVDIAVAFTDGTKATYPGMKYQDSGICLYIYSPEGHFYIVPYANAHEILIKDSK